MDQRLASGILVSMNRRTRNLIVGVSAIAVLSAVPAIASAIGVGPCDGAVKIDGIDYDLTNDTPANPIVIPDKPGLVAEWKGQTDGVIKNHTGHVGIVIGPGEVVLAEWSGENADEETESSGDYDIDDARDFLPIDVVGLYEVSASHQGDGGTCSGQVMVLIEGQPLTTPVGGGAAVGGLLALGGLALAGRGKLG